MRAQPRGLRSDIYPQRRRKMTSMVDGGADDFLGEISYPEESIMSAHGRSTTSHLAKIRASKVVHRRLYTVCSAKKEGSSTPLYSTRQRQAPRPFPRMRKDFHERIKDARMVVRGHKKARGLTELISSPTALSDEDEASFSRKTISSTEWSESLLLPRLKRSEFERASEDSGLLTSDKHLHHVSEADDEHLPETSASFPEKHASRCAFLSTISLLEENDYDDENIVLRGSRRKKHQERVDTPELKLSTTSSCRSSGVPIDAAHLSKGKSQETHSHINLELQRKYFGSQAKKNFLETYKTLRSQPYAASSLPEELRYLENSEEQVESSIFSNNFDSPRHRYLFDVLARPDLVPEMVLIRQGVSDTLNLSHKSLGDRAGEILAKVIPGLPHLRVLKLAGNRFSSRTLIPLCQELSLQTDKGQEIRSLDLDRNDCDKSSIISLSALAPTLHELVLSQNDLEDSDVAALLKAVADKNCTLKSLDLSRNTLGGAGKYYIASLDKTNVLAETLTSAHTLVHLNLSWNRISTQDAIAIATALTGSTAKLETLSLAFNSVGDKGAQQFGKCLMANTSLKKLDLTSNSIEARGTAVLAHALSSQNSTLTELTLSLNPIGLAGVRAISRAFGFLCGRPRILLYGCTFSIDVKGRSTSMANNPIRAAAQALATGFQGDGAVGIHGVDKAEFDLQLLSEEAKNYSLNGPRRELSECGSEPFDPQKPQGMYELDLADPYQACVAADLFLLAAKRPGVLLSNIEYRDSKQWRPLKLTNIQKPTSWYTIPSTKAANEKDGKRYLFSKPTAESVANDPARQYDDDDDTRLQIHARRTSTLNFTTINRLVSMIKTKVKRVRRKMTSVAAADAPFASYSRDEAIVALEAHALKEDGTDKPFLVPRSGMLRVECKVVPRLPSQLELITGSGLRLLCKYISNATNGCEQLKLLCAFACDYKFLCRQVQYILDNLGGLQMSQHNSSYVVQVFEVLLPLILDTETVDGLLSSNLSIEQVHELARRMGPLLPITLGSRAGHFVLDLSRYEHRACALALAAHSYEELMWLRANQQKLHPIPPEGHPRVAGLASYLQVDTAGPVTRSLYFTEGTAQRLDFGAFRNVKYLGQELCGALSDNFFVQVVLADCSPHTAKNILEFDYSSIVPTVNCKSSPLSNAAFKRALAECGLPLTAVDVDGTAAAAFLPNDEYTTYNSENASARTLALSARASIIDGRFLRLRHANDVSRAHDIDNPMVVIQKPQYFTERSIPKRLSMGSRDAQRHSINGSLRENSQRRLSDTINNALLTARTNSSRRGSSSSLKSLVLAATEQITSSDEDWTADKALTSVSRFLWQPRSTRDLRLLEDNFFDLPYAHSFNKPNKASKPKEFGSGRRDSSKLHLEELGTKIMESRVSTVLENLVESECLQTWSKDTMPVLTESIVKHEMAFAKSNTGLVRVIHCFKVRILLAPIGSRGLLGVRRVFTDTENEFETIAESFHGSVLPLCKTGDEIRPSLATSTAAMLYVKARILRPLGLETEYVRLVHQTSCETDVAPDFPYQLPGIETRAKYDYFDCFLKLPNTLNEASVEERLRATSNVLAMPPVGRLDDEDDTYSQSTIPKARPKLEDEHDIREDFEEAEHMAEHSALYCLCFDPEEMCDFVFTDRSIVDDVPVPPPLDIQTLYMDLRCRFAVDVLSAQQAALLAGLFPSAPVIGKNSFTKNTGWQSSAPLLKTELSLNPAGRIGGVLYREEMLVSLFGRISDAGQLLNAARTHPCSLSDAALVRLARRIGVLNLIDPVSPEGPYLLDLRYPDERRMAGILARLAFDEPGANLVNLKFRSRGSHEWIHGWNIPLAWDEANYNGKSTTPGVPSAGTLTAGFRTSAANYKTRRDLRRYCRSGNTSDNSDVNAMIISACAKRKEQGRKKS